MSKILMNDKNVRKSHKKIFVLIGILVALAAVFIYATVTMSGHWLVKDDEFEHVKWAVILDGQSANLERNDYVADLMAQGKVDSVMILGRRVYRTKSNADFYVEDFMTQGRFNPEAIFIVHHDDPSTLFEAQTVLPWLKKHKADTVLLVTSAPATRRVAKIFKTLSGESPVYLTADIHDHVYNPDTWLFNRESRKMWIREWFALAVSCFDLIGATPLTEKDSTNVWKIHSKAEEESPLLDLQSLIPSATPEPTKEPLKPDSLNEQPKDSAKTDSLKAKADSTSTN